MTSKRRDSASREAETSLFAAFMDASLNSDHREKRFLTESGDLSADSDRVDSRAASRDSNSARASFPDLSISVHQGGISLSITNQPARFIPPEFWCSCRGTMVSMATQASRRSAMRSWTSRRFETFLDRLASTSF